MTNQPQQPNPIQNNYYPDDEIELIDYLSVLWKWKWLIIMGTLLCALVAFIYGFTHPAVKMYKVSTLVEINPEVTNSFDKIKSSIKLGFLNAQILKDLLGSSAAPKIEPLAFEVSVLKDQNILHIIYKTPNPDVGKAVLGSLVKQIEEAYKERIEQIMSGINSIVKTKEKNIKDIEDHIMLTEKKNIKDIMVKKNRIELSAAKIESLKENIGRIENTMVYVKKALQLAELSAEKLVPKIEEGALIDPQDIADYENINIRVSAIQQLVNHPITLRNQINSLVREKEKFLAEILSEENRIEELKAEIELLKIKHHSIEKREIVKLKSEIESLKHDRDHVTATALKQNLIISPMPIKFKIKQNALLAGVAGLFFFVFLVFFIEYIKNASISTHKLRS